MIGGMAGTIARYSVSGAAYRIFGTSFPYGTFIVNLTGCFLVGLLASIMEKKIIPDANLRMLLMIGFCGAYTTFSTFLLETVYLMRDGEGVRALMNVILSVVAGLVVLRAGMWLGDLI